MHPNDWGQTKKAEKLKLPKQEFAFDNSFTELGDSNTLQQICKETYFCNLMDFDHWFYQIH